MSYVELPPQLFPHGVTDEEVIQMTVSTTSVIGTLMWQGQISTQSGRGKDYIALALQDGHLVFSYELGSGPATIVSDFPIDDGVPHYIIARRRGKQGSLYVDEELVGNGESEGRMTGLEANSNIYFGDVPDSWARTGGRFTHQFTGCISDVFFQSRGPVDFTRDTVRSINIAPCHS